MSARTDRLLTAAEFHRLADVPPEVEWFANISNRRGEDWGGGGFDGARAPDRLARRVAPCASSAARRSGTGWPRSPRCSNISARSNAVTHNPVKGVERPKTESGEGKTPAIGDHQARDLLAAAGRGHRQEPARPRHSLDAAVPCPAARGAVQTEGENISGTRAKACRT